MAPGPASMGIASGKIETSSLCSPFSSPEVFVLPGLPRSRSMDTMNMRIPPAMKKDPGWIPRKRRIALPVNMNTHSTTNATAMDLSIVARLRDGEREEVSDMNTGTIPKGSTTMNTARNIVKIWLAISTCSPVPSEGVVHETAADDGGAHLRLSYLVGID